MAPGGEPVLCFPGAAMVDAQAMWATAPARFPTGMVDQAGVHVSVLYLVLGRARLLVHRGYTAADWEPMEGW